MERAVYSLLTFAEDSSAIVHAMKISMQKIPCGALAIAALLAFGCARCFAGETPIRIVRIDYEISGSFWKIKKAALEKELLIDTKRNFSGEDELALYLAMKERNLRDNRSIQESARISYSLLEAEDGFILAAVTVHAENSRTFIAAPYPKYSSSKGFEAKIKLKDSNFLGSLFPLEDEVSYLLPPSDSEKPQAFNTALAGGYVFPLKNGFASPWFSGRYTFKRTDDRYKRNSGFVSGGTDFLFPVNGTVSLAAGLSAGLVYDSDVPEDFPYVSFSASAAVPLLLAETPRAGKIRFTPKITFTQNASFHGADGTMSLPDYGNLKSPSAALGAELSLGAVHWEENFRDGFSLCASVSFQNCFSEFSQNVSSSVQAELHKAFSRNGISIRRTFLAGRTEQKIGRTEDAALTDFVRGIGVQERAAFYDIDFAFVVNMDFPVRIFSTRRKKNGTNRLTDFEIHASPFADIACARFGPENGRSIGGICTAGLELVCWPLSFRSIQLRASFGKDFSGMIFSSARSRPGSSYELTIEIGLFF